MRQRSTRDATIEEVRGRFEHWRQHRKGKAAIPDELWRAAIELARRNGVNPTAAELRLDGAKLKRLMLAAGAARDEAAPPSFVELIAPAAAAVPECSVELEGRRGKLKIQIKGTSAAELASLSRMLWDLAS
jgi:hypothetical protein